ncbi:hypothetical protein [Psychrobacter sp. DAB_AL43B]|uniref:hypothetical protein n=1 Tax=Psychrobacter sp. DAB_AL43B TaxID=1028416 RepID=UPI0009A7DAE3|nr:hypothetical protein [Psychrobacter sp. DAB_AL43B]SLJ84680.1 hypothetical protein DABAL43B_1484 [Psychrobacter sp. DAB_AL43B]
MRLRPIDAIFVDPKRRLYVVYYRGELWQLPRMKIDDRSWQNRQPYTDNSSALYLSIHQAISDPVLAQKLRTLNLPVAVRGSTLPRFEAWWETHGFKWLKDKLSTGQSPLAAHQAVVAKTIDNQPTSPSNYPSTHPNNDNTTGHKAPEQKAMPVAGEATDIFADMLADLADEVLHQQL